VGRRCAACRAGRGRSTCGTRATVEWKNRGRKVEGKKEKREKEKGKRENKRKKREKEKGVGKIGKILGKN
jgi:hypothetical protein